jgi:hypothetical protein
MARSTQPSSQPQETLEAFTVRVLHYLDGDCSADDVRELREALTGSASCREWFVQICRMQGDLYEAYAPKRAARRAKAPASEHQTPAQGPRSSDFAVDQDLLGEKREAGADTLLSELSGEDTIHRNPSTPGQ